MIYSNRVAILHIAHLRPQIGLWYNLILLAKSLCRTYAKSILSLAIVRFAKTVSGICEKDRISAKFHQLRASINKHVSSRPYFPNCRVSNLYPEIDRVSAIDRSASNSGVTSNSGPRRDFGYATSLADHMFPCIRFRTRCSDILASMMSGVERVAWRGCSLIEARGRKGAYMLSGAGGGSAQRATRATWFILGLFSFVRLNIMQKPISQTANPFSLLTN
jgi:hypothetical protein